MKKKVKMTKVYIALRVDLSVKKSRLYISGTDMYPRFFRRKKDIPIIRPDETFIVQLSIPAEYVEGNDCIY